MSTIETLCKTYPETAVIILTEQFVPIAVSALIRQGIKGYLLKEDNLSLSLLAAIETARQGGCYFSETVSSELFNTSKAPTKPQLTKRQIEILTSIARQPDASYIQHAHNLGITESTLKSHLTHGRSALDVTNITGAIICCLRLGIITFESI